MKTWIICGFLATGLVVLAPERVAGAGAHAAARRPGDPANSALAQNSGTTRPNTPAELAPRVDLEPRLDVGLAWDLDSLDIRAVTGLRVYRSGDRGDVPLGECTGTLEVRNSGVAWEITWLDAAGDLHEDDLPPLDTLWIAGVEADPSAHRLSWNGKTWRGLGKVFVGPRGKLGLALRLPLESYLLGVVPGEIGGLSPNLVQAGRAQAIAARSYTLFYRGRRGEEGFDLYGTVEDQVYGPIESERELATECVRSTGGWLLLDRGQPIRANYCSTCGGITADVWEAWPTDPLDYLQSHRDAVAESTFCAASPHYRWREEWTALEFLDNVARFAPSQGLAIPAGGLGQLVDVVVERRSRSGRVWSLLVRGSNGVVRIPAYSIRQVLRRGGNANAILRSNLFKIDVRREPSTGRALGVVATGAGSGHGVGLCQTGALGMARTGKTAEQILGHYYVDAELRRLY